MFSVLCHKYCLSWPISPGYPEKLYGCSGVPGGQTIISNGLVFSHSCLALFFCSPSNFNSAGTPPESQFISLTY